MINKDEAAGKAEQAKGATKEKVGEWTGDKSLEQEGEADQASGEVKEGVGTAKRKVEETADAANQKVKDALR